MPIGKLIEAIEGRWEWHGYARSLEIARDAREVFAETSEGQRRVIEGIRAQESQEALSLRLRVSNPVTGAALAGPLSYQSKIPRAPERKEGFSYPDTNMATWLEKAFERYYGGDTLYGYIFRMSCMANNFDPNAWLVFEQSREGETLRPYPVWVSSEEAIWHQNDKFGELEYLLFVRSETAMIGVGRTVDYRHWYIYGRETTAEAIEIKPGVQVPAGWSQPDMPIRAGTEAISIAWMEYAPGLPFVPAIQLGAYQDSETPGVKGLFYQRAVPLLRDMMNKATTLHSAEIAQGFAKRFEYVKECTAENEQGQVCTGGFYGGVRDMGNRCRACGGSGHVTQMSELETIRLSWPAGADAAEMVDLSKLVHDHRPPIDTIQYFNDKVNAYYRMVNALIFNQDLTEGISMRTATEVNSAEQSITNHLLPMAEAIENAWEFGHLVAIALAGGDPGKVDVSMSHPEDYQVSPLAAVIEELNKAKQAGASMEATAAIQRRILNRLYRNDTVKVSDAMAFMAHMPWRDKDPATAVAISQARAQGDPDRLLFENFSRVQAEVFAGLGGIPFSKLKWAAQKDRIKKALDIISAEIKALDNPEPAGPEAFNFGFDDESIMANGNGNGM